MMTPRQKRRLVKVLETYDERINTIETWLVECFSGIESARETLHTLNNAITPLATNVQLDQEEITRVLKRLDEFDKVLKRFENVALRLENILPTDPSGLRPTG